MKFQNYMEIEDNLTDVETILYKSYYASKDRNEDESWSLRLEQVITEIKCLREEMLFTFKIEDD